MSSDRHRKDLFYAESEAGMYDKTIDLVVPQYRILHQCLKDLAAAFFSSEGYPTGQGVALDVGSGTGAEAIALLQRFDGLRLIAVDLCLPMHDILREKLRQTQLESRCRLVHADFLSDACSPANVHKEALSAFAKQGQQFTLVVSAFALHHLERDEKRRAYSRIYDLLSPGGLFLLADLFTFRAPELARTAHSFDLDWIRQSFSTREEGCASGISADERGRLSDLWTTHYEKENILFPLGVQEAQDEEVALLSSVGFETIEVPYRYWQTAIVWARRA